MAVGLLDLIATSGLWTNTRCHEAGYVIQQKCILCGHHNDSEYHRMWECKVVQENGHEDIVRSNFLVDFAKRPAASGDGTTAAQNHPCFWQRGLIPMDWIKEEEVKPVKQWRSGEFGKDHWELHNRVVYVDESAGKHTSIPNLRRCGWGIYMMDGDSQAIGAMSSTLCGDVEQTQIAACLDAIHHTVKFSEGDVHIKPDCNAAVDGLRKVIRGEMDKYCANAIQWQSIKEALTERRGHVRISRVDAHADVRAYIEQGLDVADWLGNEMADALAGQAAEENSVSYGTEANWFSLQGRATRILRRAIAVHRLFLAEPGQHIARGVWVQGEHPVQKAIKESGHQLIKDERGAFQCKLCGQRAGRRQLKDWLAQGPCIALRMQGSEWKSLDAKTGRSVRIGSRQTHASHCLAWHRGVWFCTACGAYAKAVEDQKSTCHNLSEECRKSANKGGLDVLNRIAQGRPPRSGMEWPLAMGHNLNLELSQPMEQLWPDRRGGSKKRKERQSTGAEDRSEGDDSRSVRARLGDHAQQEFHLCDGDEELGNGMEFVLNEDEDPWNEFFSSS